MYRIDLNDIVHLVAAIERGPYAPRFGKNPRGDYTQWTPMCQPNEDWLILKDSASNGPATCLWCLVGERFK
jgi:hypothetical protein